MRVLALVLGLSLVVASAGCRTIAGFEDWRTTSSDGETRLVTWVSSPEYAAYRQEVDGWGWFKYAAVSFGDLAGDLLDIFSVEVSMGPGFLYDIQYTKLGEMGGGYADYVKIGMRGRACGVYREKRREGGISGLYYRELDFYPIFGNRALYERPRGLRDFTLRHNSDRHWADLGGSIHAGLLGGGAYVSPMEAVDFGVNLLCLPYNLVLRPIGNLCNFRPPEIDIANDGRFAQVRKKHNLRVVEAEEGFLPAEVLDELFRLGY